MDPLTRPPGDLCRATLLVAGTRPERLKLEPVADALQRTGLAVWWVFTAQQPLEWPIAPAIKIDSRPLVGTMRERLESYARRLADVFRALRPALVVVQGDTLSATAGALAAHAQHIDVAHVEAGLRSHRVRSPFPEEILRTRIARISALHFAPNDIAAANLVAEGVDRCRVYEVGNPGIDRLRACLSALPAQASAREEIIVTIHRHENRGRALDRIAAGIHDLAAATPGLRLRLILHPNPRLAERQCAAFGALPRIAIEGPLGHREFVAALRSARLVITDSGGVEEEAPYLGCRTLIVRRCDERPGSLAWGGCARADPHPIAIVDAARDLLARTPVAPCGFVPKAPHGDGRASERIARIIGAWHSWRDEASGEHPFVVPGNA